MPGDLPICSHPSAMTLLTLPDVKRKSMGKKGVVTAWVLRSVSMELSCENCKNYY